MKHVLVTGGAGFIGSNFVRRLSEKRPDVCAVVLDSLTYAGNLDNLEGVDQGKYVFVEGDVADEKKMGWVFETLNIDTVVHFAAESHVDRSIYDPGAFIRTNITGTFVLLEAAKKAWGKRKDVRFHHVSTDEVYGSLGPKDPAFKETTPYDPSSPYSASKAAADHLARAYFRTYQLPVTISNCSNNYGPYQYPEKLIPVIILNALEGKELPVYGDGKQVRDWLYVVDHCDAILEILEKGELGETYNIGGDCEKENIWIVKQICGLLDGMKPLMVNGGFCPREQFIKHVPDRPGHDRRYAIDFRKIYSSLGWQPAHKMWDGLKKTIQWYLENGKWVKAVRERGGHAEWMKKNYELRGQNG
jgi:dTDP-glucose 4,6-dehydratase